MKIFELIGYHKHPAYRAAVNAFTYNTTDPTSFKLMDFNKRLQELGYDIEFMGRGGRGAVYKRPNDPYVIKIFHEDIDYLRYIKYVMTHQDNPHVPKIRGKLFKIDSDTYMIRMEELEPIDPRDAEQKNILDGLLRMSTWKRARQNTYIKNKAPKLYKLLTDLANMFGDESGTDLIDENIMQRKDGTIVLTDPV